ncbi:transcriptional repressor [Candidatus Saccharibacteria bacterium]|nr:transcriptional repressor [Candidatus Saccharibacteria bacterium]
MITNSDAESKTAKIRYSAQREMILDEIRSRRDHPSAAEVYMAVQKVKPTISLGTVYRVLNKLAEDGEALRLPMPDGVDRYDGFAHAHQHAFCAECRRLLDVEVEIPLEELVKFADQNKFVIEGLQICMVGKCKRCVKARKGKLWRN